MPSSPESGSPPDPRLLLARARPLAPGPTEYGYRHAGPNSAHPNLIAPLARFLGGLKPGSRVLDFGCGNGSLISRFAGKGLELHGVDSSRSGILQARLHYSGVTFHLADITQSPPPELAPASFDAAVCFEVIEHLFEPRLLLRNAYSLLKPGGRFLLSTPYHGYLKNLALALSGRMDRHFHVLKDYGHIKFFSRSTLGCLLQESGFEDLRFSAVGRAPWLWKSMLFHARKPQSA